MRSTHLYHLENLSTAEKIQLVEDLWDEIAEHSEEFPLSASQKEELDRRIAEHEMYPEEGSSWEEVKQRIKGEN
ncbi:MAG: addiction module protein [Deltaproteobacteria bacterium]|nr:addiction module protein [Deltaproteobacteria bacterium]